jgi:Fur family ferric uptake transcriptional regulator
VLSPLVGGGHISGIWYSRAKPMQNTGNTLKQRGIRLTKQRQILLDIIDKSGAHLDAEQLYRLAQKKDPKLNRVTVYRTLKLLKEGGLVDELDLMHYAGDQHFYETRLKQEHAHVICMQCGRVEEYFGEPLRVMRQQIQESLGFEIQAVRTEVGGYCSHCQALRNQLKEASEPSTDNKG